MAVLFILVQSSDKSILLRIETILHIVLKFEVNRTLFQTRESSAKFGGKVAEKEKKEQSIRSGCNNMMSAFQKCNLNQSS